MRELGGLMDNLYLQSKNRMGDAAPPTPQRHKKKVRITDLARFEGILRHSISLLAENFKTLSDT